MGGDFHAARCVPTFIEITERPYSLIPTASARTAEAVGMIAFVRFLCSSNVSL